jgi:hypothetical protein
MGQAKQRGSFEQRQAEAVVREAEERRQRMERARLAPKRRDDPTLAALLAIMMANTTGNYFK